MPYVNKRYNDVRNRQIKQLQILKRPRTDLMDLQPLRKQIEDVLTLGQAALGGWHENGSEPYATSSIASAYHKEREDNLFVKEASVIISDFGVVCKGVNSYDNPIRARLYYFNNMGNYVGTYIMALQFRNLTVDEVIRLKHAFYKRAQVNIIEDNTDVKMTFQDYICKMDVCQSFRRATDIDCRARYTFLETNKKDLMPKEIYGLLTSNEKYPYTKVRNNILKDMSKECAHSLYYNLRSALLLNHCPHDNISGYRMKFFGKLEFDIQQIDVECLRHDEWIAGLRHGYFPDFQKTVEVHCLTNNAQRHETVRHELSYWNPRIFIKRRYKIWKILYELDINHCLMNREMLQSFGVNDELCALKEEYQQLTNHTFNYIVMLTSIIAVILSLLSFINNFIHL